MTTTEQADQLELAARILREGLEWEACDLNGAWRGPYIDKMEAVRAIANSVPIRIKPPAPVPVPEGYRELSDGEKDGKWIQGAKFFPVAGGGWMANNCGGRTGCYASRTQRIIVPAPLKQVPLEPGDVPPGSVIRGSGESKFSNYDRGWCLITSCSETGIRIWRGCDDHGTEWRWRDLMESQVQILRPSDTEWQPCSKPEPSELQRRLHDAHESSSRLRDTIKRLEAEKVMLAKLSAETPQFFNPWHCAEAIKLRDAVLANVNVLAPAGEKPPTKQENE